MQGGDSLIEFLHRKVVETLSDLMRRCCLSRRSAKDFVIVCSHAKPASS